MHTSLVEQTLSSIILGPETSHRNLVMIPLLRRDPAAGPVESAADYAVLDDAIASNAVEITEVSEQGSVPELRVVNRGPKPALIIDGEELIGAKQNRVVNLTILVTAHATVTIPVSCVEAGRWRARSRTFASAPRTQYAAGRAKRMSQVTQSIETRMAYFSDQSAVWADIAEKSERLRTSSPTGAMDAMFVDYAGDLDQCVAVCQAVDGQVGALFMIADRLVGLDVFDSERTLRKLLPKLVRSVTLDALDPNERPTGASRAAADARGFDSHVRAQRFLHNVGTAPQHVCPAIGMGEDVRLSAADFTGAALVVDQRVVHLSAFALA